MQMAQAMDVNDAFTQLITAEVHFALTAHPWPVNGPIPISRLHEVVAQYHALSIPSSANQLQIVADEGNG